MSSASRRGFLLWTLSGVGVALIAGPGCGKDRPWRPDVDPSDLPDTRLPLKPLLRAWFAGASLEAISAVGLAYIARFEPDSETAVADLSEAVLLIADLAEEAEALAVLDDAVIADFEADGLTPVQGWQLSITEVRLCALADLLLEVD